MPCIVLHLANDPHLSDRVSSKGAIAIDNPSSAHAHISALKPGTMKITVAFCRIGFARKPKLVNIGAEVLVFLPRSNNKAGQLKKKARKGWQQ